MRCKKVQKCEKLVTAVQCDANFDYDFALHSHFAPFRIFRHIFRIYFAFFTTFSSINRETTTKKVKKCENTKICKKCDVMRMRCEKVLTLPSLAGTSENLCGTVAKRTQCSPSHTRSSSKYSRRISHSINFSFVERKLVTALISLYLSEKKNLSSTT
jgi:hypothetical protein